MRRIRCSEVFSENSRVGRPTAPRIRLADPMSMAIENVALLAIENVTLRGLTCGGSGATGAGEPAKSLVTLMRPALGKRDVQYVFGLRSDGSPSRARRGGASGSCCPGC